MNKMRNPLRNLEGYPMKDSQKDLFTKLERSSKEFNHFDGSDKKEPSDSDMKSEVNKHESKAKNIALTISKATGLGVSESELNSIADNLKESKNAKDFFKRAAKIGVRIWKDNQSKKEDYEKRFFEGLKRDAPLAYKILNGKENSPDAIKRQIDSFKEWLTRDNKWIQNRKSGIKKLIVQLEKMREAIIIQQNNSPNFQQSRGIPKNDAKNIPSMSNDAIVNAIFYYSPMMEMGGNIGKVATILTAELHKELQKRGTTANEVVLGRDFSIEGDDNKTKFGSGNIITYVVILILAYFAYQKYFKE